LIIDKDESNGHNKITPIVTTSVLTPIADADIEPAIITVTPLVSEPPKKPVPQHKKKIVWLVAGVGIGAVVASIFGYRYWQYASTHQTTDNAIVTGSIHQVSSKIAGTVTDVLVHDNQQVQPGQLLIKLDPRDYQNKLLQAKTALESAKRQASAAQANIDLASQTSSGKTSQAQGDVSTAQAAIATAQATITEAKAGIPAAQAIVEEAQAGVLLSQAQVGQANANLQKSQIDYNRYRTLNRQGVVTNQQFDTVIAAYDTAKAQKSSALHGVEQAEAQLDAAKVGVTKAKSQLAQAQTGIASVQAKLAAAQGSLQQATASGEQTTINRRQYQAAQSVVAQAEVALKDAQLQLSYMNITAPSAGHIGKKSTEVGNRIQIGSPLMVVVNNDYWIVANFKETQLNKIKAGQPVEIKLDAFPNKVLSGKVDSLAPASGAQFSLLPPDNATGNFTKIVQRIPVKIKLDSQSITQYATQIKPGMSAEVSIEIK
jgi:membrane fusion protein, multidrug efflux system